MSIEFEQLFMDRSKGGMTANIKAVVSSFVVSIIRPQLYKTKGFYVRILIGGGYMNDKELKQKVNNAMYTLMKEKGVCTPVDVLMFISSRL